MKTRVNKSARPVIDRSIFVKSSRHNHPPATNHRRGEGGLLKRKKRTSVVRRLARNPDGEYPRMNFAFVGAYATVVIISKQRTHNHIREIRSLAISRTRMTWAM